MNLLSDTLPDELPNLQHDPALGFLLRIGILPMGFIGFSGGREIKLTSHPEFRRKFTLVFRDSYFEDIYKTHQLLNSALGAFLSA